MVFKGAKISLDDFGYNGGMLGKKKESFWAGFKWAYQGLVETFKKETNFRVQCGIALLVVLLGWYLGLSRLEWLMVVVSIFGVLGAELFNTAIENLVDLHITKIHPAAKIAKDAAAAGVLVVSLMAAVVGVLVFGPHVFR